MPNTELSMTTVQVTIQDIDGGKIPDVDRVRFPSVEALEQLATTGIEPADWVEKAEEGLTQAVAQIDAIHAEDS